MHLILDLRLRLDGPANDLSHQPSQTPSNNLIHDLRLRLSHIRNRAAESLADLAKEAAFRRRRRTVPAEDRVQLLTLRRRVRVECVGRFLCHVVKCVVDFRKEPTFRRLGVAAVAAEEFGELRGLGAVAVARHAGCARCGRRRRGRGLGLEEVAGDGSLRVLRSLHDGAAAAAGGGWGSFGYGCGGVDGDHDDGRAGHGDYGRSAAGLAGLHGDGRCDGYRHD